MQTTALLVGFDDAPLALLKETARQIGFSPIYVTRNVSDLERRGRAAALFYVLFAAVDKLRRLKPIIDDIRRSEVNQLRYAPLVYFSEGPSLETIKTCIGMGFDDIISLPFALRRARERLARQVDQPVTYYGTDTYFGPDRRGRLPQEDGHSMRGSGGMHRRIEILRTAAGVRVLQDDLQVIV